MIHVCYALFDRDGKYSKFIGTSILSMFENTHEKITVHLIHDSTLTDDNRKKFLKIVLNYDQEIIFYDVDNERDEILTAPTIDHSRHTLAVMYRLLIPELLPKNISRAIYLDADIIINRDINDLWTVDMKDLPIAAMPECFSGQSEQNISGFGPVSDGIVHWQNYFNSGVLILNLEGMYTGGGGTVF